LVVAALSCENGLDELLTVTSLSPPATKAIAAAAETSVTAIAVRRHDRKEFGRLNQRGVFIDLSIEKNG
jgi:hypothetical protein